MTPILSVQGPPSRRVASANFQEVSSGLSRGLKPLGDDLRPTEIHSGLSLLRGNATQSGTGMFLGNPRQPWNGSRPLVRGAPDHPRPVRCSWCSLQGLPWIGIGFTRDLAWTHTVDYATRFTLYEVTLNPENPMQYDYDGEWRDIEATTVSAQQLQSDGSLKTVEHVFYSTHYGLVLDLGGVDPAIGGWPTFAGTLITMRDANLDTGLRSLTQFVEKAQASDMEGYRHALRHIGNPVFHEFAADRHGTMYYGQISAVPHVTQTKLDDCQTGIMAIVASVSTNAFIGLNGSRSACEWGEARSCSRRTDLHPMPDPSDHGAWGGGRRRRRVLAQRRPRDAVEGFTRRLGLDRP